MYGVYTSGVSHFIDTNFFWDSTGVDFGPFTNWAENEPHGQCVYLKNEGGVFKWAATTCSVSHFYICAADL